MTVPGGAQARVSIYANDVSIFVSCYNDTEEVQKVLEQYEDVMRAKINHKSSSFVVKCLEKVLLFWGSSFGLTVPFIFLECGLGPISS